MTTITKHTCEYQVPTHAGSYQTSNHGVRANYYELNTRAGKMEWYCKIHAPSVRTTKRNARIERYESKLAGKRNLLERRILEGTVLRDIPNEALDSKQALYIWLLNHSQERLDDNGMPKA